MYKNSGAIVLKGWDCRSRRYRISRCVWIRISWKSWGQGTGIAAAKGMMIRKFNP